MAYCSFCQQGGIPEEHYTRNTYCPFCGKLLKEAYADTRAAAAYEEAYAEELRALEEEADSYASSYSSDSSYSSSYSGGGYSSGRSGPTVLGTILTTLAVAAIAYFLFGETAAGVVVAIGAVYLLRHVIKVLFVFGAGAFCYMFCDGLGINGFIGAIVGVLLACALVEKITRFFND